MMQGEKTLAFLKIFRMALSDSPTYIEYISGPLIPIKFNFDYVAIAFAIIVLLHPGGPYSNIPLLGSIPSNENFYGYFNGNSVTFLI
jgi:hypothetical protein